jgi:hypothetical protein
MAYSEFLADRIRQRLQYKGLTAEKKMMGFLIFMVNHKMCLGINTDKKTQAERLMVRVGKESYEELLQIKGSNTMDFTKKEMRGFLFIDAESFDKENDLDFWIEKALKFNHSLLK